MVMHLGNGGGSRAGRACWAAGQIGESIHTPGQRVSAKDRSPGFGRWTTPRAVPGIIDAVVTQPYQDCRLAGAYQPGNEMPASSLQSWVGLITSFAPTGPSRVLDVGAGTGMFAARVRRIRRGREE
jgi:hypothetical protein